MYIKNIRLFNIAKYKRIFIVIIIVIICTISLALVLKKENNSIEYRFDGKNKISLTSYYSKSNVQVASNKNANTYIIEEWYVKQTGNKFKIIDSIWGEVTYLLKGNNLIIKNNKQKSILELLEYNNQDMNILSLNTFVTTYNKYVVTKNNKLSIKTGETFQYISVPYLENTYTNILELKIKKQNNKIMSLTIKDKLGKDRIVITYLKLELNKPIDANIFI